MWTRVEQFEPTKVKVVQVNINHCKGAQQLLQHHLNETSTGLCCISEPWFVPDEDNRWFVSENARAAILVNTDVLSGACILARVATDYVACLYKKLCVISVYLSPNVGIGDFIELLRDLGDFLRTVTGEIIISGDFNAKSTTWGCTSTDRRGVLLTEWAAEQDLRLHNIGNTPTCNRPQGTSVVDLTWSRLHASSGINGWVVEDTETMSDHAYISFTYTSRDEEMASMLQWKHPRWSKEDFDAEMFKRVVEFECTGGWSMELPTDEVVSKITGSMVDGCDLASRRVGRRPPRKAAYWWNRGIEVVRAICTRSRRKLTRLRRRGPSMERDQAEIEYRAAKRTLKAAIREAKTKAWRELILTVNSDPWGLPFKVVMKKLRRVTPRITETLENNALERLMGSLFPNGDTHDPREIWGGWQGPLEDYGVTMDELKAAIIRGRKKGGNPTPGPDGLTSWIWSNIPRLMAQRLVEVMNACFSRGEYPSEWKRAILVLIPKGGAEGANRAGTLKARPICLLNEGGKIFERIILGRIEQHMNEHREAALSSRQYGFRKGKSTVDALMDVVGSVKRRLDRGDVVIAAGIDIENAFNSLPWPAIRWALGKGEYPVYLRRLIDSYLHNRSVEYYRSDGRLHQRAVTAGVPQGSILGPVLWNIAFDYAIEMHTRPGCEIYAYADDTLVLAAGATVEQARERMNEQLVPILRRIEALGLKVAVEKTDAIVFHKPRRRLDMELPVCIRVNEEYVRTSNAIKYLGVMLDSRLNFVCHFRYVGEKMGRVSRALSGLMPNVRGPDESKRRLYACVLGSVALYGAPVWSQALANSVVGKRILRAAQRTVAARVCSAFRTTSFDALTLVARMVPYELAAAERRRIYGRTREARDRGVIPDAEGIIEQEKQATFQQWEAYLNRDELPGRWTRDAIRPHMDGWMTRAWGSLNFYTTQFLTDHGGFAKFLARIGKLNSNNCFCCEGRNVDDARHTLLECPRWERQRVRMTETTGPLTSLAELIAAITRSREAWSAFGTFAEETMRAKRVLEDVEHEREREEREERSSSSGRVSEVEHLSLAIREERARVGEAPFRIPASSEEE